MLNDAPDLIFLLFGLAIVMLIVLIPSMLIVMVLKIYRNLITWLFRRNRPRKNRVPR